MRSMLQVFMGVLALTSCGGPAHEAERDRRLARQSPPSGIVAPVMPPPPRVEPQETCAARLLREHHIDVGPAPAICEPLSTAIAFLGPAAQAEIKDLVIVRGARGPCADVCPNLASALMSDAALAFYRIGAHELHVLDAMFDGPRWRSPAPSDEALTAYLDELGLTWEALVARTREVTGVALPDGLPRGDQRLFQAIVEHGPRILLGREVSHESILLHELGHAVLLRSDGEARRTALWATLSDWREASPRGYDIPADGVFVGQLTGERPIVASRLALALPRGDDALYRPHLEVFATGYAAFDPREDYAEALRLLRDDPERLGRLAPAKLLYMLAEVGTGLPVDRLRALLEPHRPFIGPGLEALGAFPEARQRVEAALGSALVAP
jgi:hypothetical protein